LVAVRGDLCVHDLFEEQAARTPDAVAVVRGAERLTYRQLDERANQVAHVLRRRGAGRDVLVGVCVERTPELVVALLAVWKAGGAYVPLDPAYPPERLAFMVGDAGMRAVLADGKSAELLRGAGVEPLRLDGEHWRPFAQEPVTRLERSARPSDLAYVMYTSGSTGKPKGAMIVQSGLVNYLLWAIDTYRVVAGGSVAVHSSIAFDLTVTSLYPALLVGGQVELLPEDSVGARNLLAALRARKDRNLVKLTPAHLDLLTQQLRPEELAGLTRLFVIGGENLSAESLAPWRDFAPETRLINEYGPTETVVGCCVHEVQPADARSGPVPIGRAIAETQLYVLDEGRRRVAPGTMGELYIGGAGVARGYLNREELTKERFLPDPFAVHGRMYKTGDLARERPDGVLEYLGRVDNQVKVRGYRIELGEIEATLAGHASVQSCAVLAREDVPGDKQLVAYVVARDGKEPPVEELSGFLGRQLPEYMVPARVVFLATMPLTHNGKVDRAALPAPSVANTATARAAGGSVGPRNAEESAIAAIWRELLRVADVGVETDFFEAGGHSLLALQILVQIRDKLGVDLPPETLFEHATVAALATLVRRAKGLPEQAAPAPAPVQAAAPPPSPLHANGAPPAPAPAASSPLARAFRALVQIKKEGSRVPFFCVHGSGGNVLNFRVVSRAMPPEQPFYGLQAYGVDGVTRPHATIEEMADAYLREIREVQSHGPYLLGGYSGGGIVAFEMAQRLTAAGERVALLAFVDTFHPSMRIRKVPFGHRLERMRKEPVAYLQHVVGRRVALVRERWQLHQIDRHLREGSEVPLTLRELQLVKSFAAATERYRPKPWSGRATLFRVEQVAYVFGGLGSMHGWEKDVLGGVDVQIVPGDHDSLVHGPNAEAFTRLLNGAIEKALSK
jgi:amino acid adenylation domain-containing protein